MTDENVLLHYGVARRSGRYPWGSGATPEEHNRSLLGYVDSLRAKGVSEVDIAKGLELTTTELRAAKAIAKNSILKSNAAQALRLKDKGLSNVAIGQRMGINESSVRSLIDPALQDRRDILVSTAAMLKAKISDGSYLDIGAGTENHLDISPTKLSTAVAMLKHEGYEVHKVQVDQLGTGVGNKTTIKVLAPPGTKYVDIVTHPEKIKSVAAFSEDGGLSYRDVKPPVNISSDRLGIRYAEQGGTAADGVIYLRRGVDDISLGSSRYAQVRIAVDGTHYIKGMGMYNDDMPKGVDLQFNTNKSDTGNKLDALKKQTDDADTPFGAIVRQRYFTDSNGKEKQSAINLVNEEGDWKDWSRSLSSQVLSKQSTALAKRQLDLAFKSRLDEYDEISHLTNPVVKQKLLGSFADSAESASVHLKAAALPGQGTHVILPLESLKESEIYAPNYRDGTKVALVRFPHGGTFEIPEVTVNNKNPEGRAKLGFPVKGNPYPKAVDAVGIHPNVASRLSGADFDGDTVLVIPNDNGAVKTSAPLAGLKDFEPKQAYAPYDGMKTIDGGTYDAATKSVDYGDKGPSGRAKQQQMGDVSNLITDMTIKGANNDELAAAVRHSMVVIDAEKHNLNYRQSSIDNGISALKEKYQGRGPTGRLAGASTIISRSGNATINVPDRKLRRASDGGPIDPLTGKKVFVDTGETYTDKKSGKLVVKTIKSKPLLEIDDAHGLSSGTPIEEIYANHSNSLKALTNDARKAALMTGKLVYSPTANKTYASEVASLNSKLNTALKNSPRERQAQLIANVRVNARLKDNPQLEASDVKKIKGQELNAARDLVGAKKERVEISPAEWAAIQAGAISTNKLERILDNADLDKVKELATPRAMLEVTPAKLQLALARLASGYTQSEIAESLGIPVSTLNAALKKGGGNDGS